MRSNKVLLYTVLGLTGYLGYLALTTYESVRVQSKVQQAIESTLKEQERDCQHKLEYNRMQCKMMMQACEPRE